MFIAGEGGIHQVKSSFAGKSRMMTRETSRQDAIEDVNAAQNAIDQIFGRADAHQIARLVFGKIWIHHIEHRMHFVFGLAHRQPADGNAGRIER